MTILETIGNTPLIQLPYFSPEGKEIYAKLEGTNPGGSIKDRIALEIIQVAEYEGILNPDSIIIEATSGNTGIGLAMVCAVKGYRCIIAMPENMSDERKKILRQFGAELMLSSVESGMTGAIELANEIARNNTHAFLPEQFANPSNPDTHRKYTGPEIKSQLNYCPTAFVAGVGTGGTIMGVAQYFKLDEGAGTKIIAVEPAESAVLSGEPAGKHGIQGIGAGFIPDILNIELINHIEKVSTEEAIELSRALGAKAGISAGISSGANLLAAIRIAKQLPKNSTIVTIFSDSADRYVSLL